MFLTFILTFLLFLSCLSCEVAQFIPSSLIRLFSPMCCDENLLFFFTSILTQRSKKAIPTKTKVKIIVAFIPYYIRACKSSENFGNRQIYLDIFGKMHPTLASRVKRVMKSSENFGNRQIYPDISYKIHPLQHLTIIHGLTLLS